MSNKNFLTKIRDQIFSDGKEVILLGLTFWYCATDPETPAHIKALLFGYLAYLVSPIDAIPDFTPVIGFSDDLALMTATAAFVVASIRPIHRQQALSTYSSWA